MEVDAFNGYQLFIALKTRHRLRRWTLNIHIDVDKEHRLRKRTPINVIKYSCTHRQGAVFVEVDAYQCYQIFM